MRRVGLITIGARCGRDRAYVTGVGSGITDDTYRRFYTKSEDMEGVMVPFLVSSRGYWKVAGFLQPVEHLEAGEPPAADINEIQ